MPIKRGLIKYIRKYYDVFKNTKYSYVLIYIDVCGTLPSENKSKFTELCANN